MKRIHIISISVLAGFLLGVVSPVHATMQRTLLIDAQVEGIVVCETATAFALEPDSKLTFEKVTNDVVVAVRHKVNQEGDTITAGSPEDRILDKVDHDAWHYGVFLVKEKNITDKKQLENFCVYAALSNVKEMAHQIGADDFIQMNPNVFEGIE
ncbi:hypothetical protein QUR06_000250 [Escherichia coli]|nr:hypothetical protein [Escherichia coli]